MFNIRVFLRAEEAVEGMRGADEFDDYEKSGLDSAHVLDRQ